MRRREFITLLGGAVAWPVAGRAQQPAKVADPFGTGHVTSLARPGGNITGLSVLLTELAAKALELLKEALPHATRIGVLWNPTTPSHPIVLQAVEGAAKQLGVQLRLVPAATIEAFDEAFATMSRQRLDGFLVLASPLGYLPGGVRQAELALKHRLPGVFGFKDNAEAGGLMSYSAAILDLFRRSPSTSTKFSRAQSLRNCPSSRVPNTSL